MCRGRASAAFELAYEKGERNHCDREPRNHPKAVHKGQKCALLQKLLVHDAERGAPGVGAGDSMLHKVAHHAKGVLLQAL